MKFLIHIYTIYENNDKKIEEKLTKDIEQCITNMKKLAFYSSNYEQDHSKDHSKAQAQLCRSQSRKIERKLFALINNFEGNINLLDLILKYFNKLSEFFCI